MEKNVENKESKLLETAFSLFTSKGVKDTSIQEIADNADIGKGTFYLYFKDKYELRDVLIAKKSHKLFGDALKSLRENYIESFPDQVIYIINYVIDELSKNTILLKFIYKNLSWGIYNQAINQIYQENENEEDGIYSLFMKGVEESNLKLENPDVTLSLIIELTSSTCFNSILYKNPLPINEFKPYLYKSIRKLLE